jgi:solute:Na+ symporter, SSS family
MELSVIDLLLFVLFFATVIGVSIYKSRKEKNAEDYFLAGRGLKWYLIGFSIVAANISTEQFVGMSGQGAGSVGLAVAGYQLFGAITIVIVALWFLPKFLRAGIYTMPEYLEYRYNPAARAIMALATVVIYVTVTTTAVLYSGAITLHTVFDMDLVQAVWLIGIIAVIYTAWGGLQAVAWADLFQGAALLIGGLVVMTLGFQAIGGIAPFFQANTDKLHMVLPKEHPEMPWTVLVFGLWIPNFYYCGLNQFIVQRTLAAKSLQQGQWGIIFAAALWLLIPFAIVFPGIMAVQLYGDKLASADQAFPTMIRNLVPMGWRGFIFAALAGAVVSTLASVLNSASTILTMDLYKRHWVKEASQKSLVAFARITTVVFMLIGCWIAPQLADPRFGGIFHYIQEFQGYISPGILAAFVFGFVVKRAPAAAGVSALLLSAPIYGLLAWQYGHIAFLNRMAITFVALLMIMSTITALQPLRQPKVLPVRPEIETSTHRSVPILGSLVILAVIAFYIIFW